MFVVAVEKVDGDGPDPVIIVRKSWLTPKKQECFWPPGKQTEKFNAALSRTESPGENWDIIKIKKRLYETDDLLKAREKARQAEIESDLLTDEDTFNSNRRAKIKKRKITEQSDEQDSSDESECLDDFGHIPNPPTSSLPDVQINKFPVRSFAPSSCSTIESFTTQHPWSSIYTPNISVENSPSIQNSSEFKVLVRKIENLREVVEENNKLLHALIVEKKAAEDSSPGHENLPFCLPLKTLKDVEQIEEFLKDSDTRKNFVAHLAIIGGLNAEKHVRRMLRTVFTDELAQNYNWMGKGDKKSLKETIFPSIIIDAVKRNQKNFAGTTICQLENVMKQWFRFAKDRSGGRDKRRSKIKNTSVAI